MRVVGIDSGSTTTKLIVLEDNQVIFERVRRTGANSAKTASVIFEEMCSETDTKRDQINYIVSTGYGRKSIDFADKEVTEITCHARGVNWLFPNAAIVIDIGGQDSKVIKLSSKGNVLDFRMNEKCAAGTGRFLEVMANALETDLNQFGPLSLAAKNRVEISSMCTVFAESEVISNVAKGSSLESIIAGVHESIGVRVFGLAKGLLCPGDVVMSGGVAKNQGMVAVLEEKIGQKIYVPENPQTVGALGAAVIGAELLAGKPAVNGQAKKLTEVN